MWFSGFVFLILSLIVEVYLWWKLQASLIFLSGRTCTIGGWLNTFLPHCISSWLPEKNCFANANFVHKFAFYLYNILFICYTISSVEDIETLKSPVKNVYIYIHFIEEGHIFIWNPITFSWDVDFWQTIWKLVRFKWLLKNIIIFP